MDLAVAESGASCHAKMHQFFESIVCFSKISPHVDGKGHFFKSVHRPCLLLIKSICFKRSTDFSLRFLF